MENVILVIHLILAICLIGVVLLQRSEGGGLGMGGGGGGGAMTGRSAASALGKITWVFAVAFLVTSITLTILSAQNSGGGSVLDRVTDAPAEEPGDAPVLPDLSGDGPLLPPSDSDAPLVPPRTE
ncbi:preprotein translocase subunit SecG [Alterinioella nitratireducens]|jgi:preprotein translocase subunit SecG|uniref:preprotein translocase subunit SecG n=1 Tax=Alterinioella nitratireducens TaxID=2735915 RepID=UPI000C96009E|nr:preprotein translocase subunit SecG [Alterinioella nitratireducens]MAN13394.1 preprotein translocase subunit SecG [Dinoroseobacter sp.]NPD18152.1 preprotein translocase subunit SecG [Alterinioella nitratireducens]|tara:strand:- start:57 stop:431 length:375 start_codon:yes stop_codon:yes gene_type:complete